MRGILFPYRFEDGEPDFASVGSLAVLSGILLAASLNVVALGDVSYVEVGVASVVATSIIPLVFWIISKIFIGVTISSRKAVMYFVESAYVSWSIFLVFTIVLAWLGTGEAVSIVRDLRSDSVPLVIWVAIFLGFISIAFHRILAVFIQVIDGETVLNSSGPSLASILAFEVFKWAATVIMIASVYRQLLKLY